MKVDIQPPGDDKPIRCPRLGHQIAFSYCRKENEGLPCPKILDCWFSYFAVEEFLRQELKPDEWEKVFGKPSKSKIQSLMDLIDQAKKYKEEAGS